MCRECGGSRSRVADHSIEVHDDGLVMPARCELLTAIRSRDSRSVLRCHRDIRLWGMGSYVWSGCIPPTPGEGGAITATRFPHCFVLLDSCISPPRPRHKERVSAHLELAIHSFLFPSTPSCVQPLRLFPLSFYHLGILTQWVFLCLSLLVLSSVQGPSTRHGDWFALSCSDEASKPVSRILEKLLFGLRAAWPLQLKFEDVGFVYVPMVW